ncbi:hypothetical protein N7475_006332 [Penicillium sp. IBT 31633x]|nr:hypothetical protein N7475_006332 [Penicillium sp. IBT 31633x]
MISSPRTSEDGSEEWSDDEIHEHYNVPMVAVRAKPRVLMHCDVRRDTSSGLHISVSIDKWINTEYFIWEMAAGLADSGINPKWTHFFEEHYKATWVQVQDEFDGIADLPERFLRKVRAPPFQVAELRIQSDQVPRYWRLRANTGRHMIDTSFWDLWKAVLRRDIPSVGPFDVILRAPSRIPAGEDPVDPWNMSPSIDYSEADCRADGSYSGWTHTFDDPAPLEPLRLPNEQCGDKYPSTGRTRSGSVAAIRALPHRLRDCLSRSNSTGGD